MQPSADRSRWSTILVVALLLAASVTVVFVFLSMRDQDHHPQHEVRPYAIAAVFAGPYLACGVALLVERSFGSGLTFAASGFVVILLVNILLFITIMSPAYSGSDVGGLYLSGGTCLLANLGLSVSSLRYSHTLQGYSPTRFAWGMATAVGTGMLLLSWHY